MAIKKTMFDPPAPPAEPDLEPVAAEASPAPTDIARRLDYSEGGTGGWSHLNP